MDSDTQQTILLVDDYDSVRIALSLILTKNGFRVLAAANSVEVDAIWKEERENIDLLLVDISMPLISGPDLVRALFKDGTSLPVIFITGTSKVLALEATQNIPRSLILHKPFAPHVLLEAIRNLSGTKPLAVAVAA